MPEPNPNPPAPVVPPTPPPAGDPPAAPPPGAPPAGTRTAAEIENENLKLQITARNLEKDLHNAREEKRKAKEQLDASRAALKAAGVIENDGDDPKAVVEKHQKEQRSKELRQNAIERAALKKLIPTGLGEADADLILGSILRTPGVTFDETTGVVSGLDEAFAALKPTIERLSSKGGSPPLPAPPAPPNPSSGATPPDPKFAAVKTAKDFMLLPASQQEDFEAKHPNEAKKFIAEFERGASLGRAPTFAPVARA